MRVDTEPDEEVYDDVQDINNVKDGRNGMQKSKGRRVCRHLNKSVKVREKNINSIINLVPS